MSIRQDWSRLVRNIHGLLSTLKSAAAWEESWSQRSRKARPITMTIRTITDHSMIPEIKFVGTFALAYNLRNQLR